VSSQEPCENASSTWALRAWARSPAAFAASGPDQEGAVRALVEQQQREAQQGVRADDVALKEEEQMHKAEDQPHHQASREDQDDGDAATLGA
jgi:hypothetical protein